jgi:quinol-cytochrome oxidoreductase complex cytochrome b subunit
MGHVFSVHIILFHTQTSGPVMGKDKDRKKKKKEESESMSDSGPDDVSTWMFDKHCHMCICMSLCVE